MEIHEQQARLSQIIEKNRPFENLLSNDDFLQWRDGAVKERLDSILEAIKTVDRSQADWKEKVCDAVVAYQEANMTYNMLFTVAAKAAEQARKTLTELAKAQGQHS